MLSDNISDRTLVLLFPNVIIYLLGIWIFHFSFFTFHLPCATGVVKGVKVKCLIKKISGKPFLLKEIRLFFCVIPLGFKPKTFRTGI